MQPCLLVACVVVCDQEVGVTDLVVARVARHVFMVAELQEHCAVGIGDSGCGFCDSEEIGPAFRVAISWAVGKDVFLVAEAG